MAPDGQDDFWRARTPGTGRGGATRDPGRREEGGLTAAAGLPETAGLAGRKPPPSERPDPPGDRRLRLLLVTGAAALAVVAIVVGAVLVFDGDEERYTASSGPLTSAGPAPADVTFTDDECGAWEPEQPDDVRGWLYRSCLRKDEDDARAWIAGVQVHNVGTESGDLRVFLSYLSVGPAGRSPITLRESDADFAEVEPDGIATRAVARYRHPGGQACVWLEAAPLFLSGRQWSASPGVDVTNKACERPEVES